MAKKKKTSDEAKEVKQKEDAESQASESKEEKKEVIEQVETKKDSRNLAMLCHLLAIFVGFLAPLIIWLIKKDEDAFVDDQGKEALNFQITVILAAIAAGFLSLLCVGIPLLIAIPVLNLIFCIIAAVKSSGGVRYRYPVAIRFLK